MLEKDLALNNHFEQHSIYKNELAPVFEKILDCIKIRSKCYWYERGEKY